MIVIVIATLINRKKIMRMCGSSEKEGGGLWESGGWPGEGEGEGEGAEMEES